MPPTDPIAVFGSPSPRVRRVPIDRPWAWLAAGWNDLLGAWRVSLVFGAALVAISAAITAALAVTGFVYLLLPLGAGFFFVAPVLAVGLYEVSRRRQLGEPPSWRDAALAWQRNASQIALMGLALMLLHLVWVRIATLLFALFFQDASPSLERLVDLLLFSTASLPFLVTGTVIGAALAAVAFAIGAIAIPMLLDRDLNVIAAIATSIVAVRANWPAMALWAALIVVITSVGFATFYVGFAVAVPLIAHASWHAYKDLVD
jgi:uncharacterized membrane protein